MSTPPPSFGPGAEQPRPAQPGQPATPQGAHGAWPPAAPAPAPGQPAAWPQAQQGPGGASTGPVPGPQGTGYPPSGSPAAQGSPYPGPSYGAASPVGAPGAWHQPVGPGGSWTQESDKSFVVAWLLSLFLGVFGADRFYRGFIGLGILKLLTCGGAGIWALVDLIIMLATGGKDSQGRPLAKYESNRTVAWVVTAVVVVISFIGGAINGASGSDQAVAPGGSEQSAPAAVAAPAEEAQPAAATQAPAEPTTEAPAPEATATPAPEVALPATQVAFAGAVETARGESEAATTDLQRANVLNTRSEAMCGAVPDGRIEKWVGTVETVDANGEGKAVVTLSIEEDIEIGTWNNALSDFDDHTLIEQGTPLFDQALALSPGDKVEFSGTLKSGSESNDRCYYTSNLTEVMSIDSPDYIVNFSELTKVA